MRQNIILFALVVLAGVPLLAQPKGPDRSGHWTVEIVQGGSVKATMDSKQRGASATLAKKPFTIRVRMDQPVDVLMNAMTTAAAAERLKGGFDVSRDCPSEDVVPTEETRALFPCPGTTMAIVEDDTTLLTGDGSHILSADPFIDSWTRTREERGRWLLERDVTEINGRSISAWHEPLTLVLVTMPVEGRLGEENIRRIMLMFLDR